MLLCIVGVALSGVRHAYASSQVFADFRPVFVTASLRAAPLLRAAIRRDMCMPVSSFVIDFRVFRPVYSVVQRGLRSWTLYRVGHAYAS